MVSTNYLKLTAALFLLSACGRQPAAQNDEQAVLALLYQQQSAEYRALCLQSYNLARRQLDAALAMPKPHKRLAVVTDLDETALDNSADAVYAYRYHVTLNKDSITKWERYGQPLAVPGAVAFFNDVYRHRSEVDLYYVSNRPATAAIIGATRQRMAVLGFPYCTENDNGHFLFQSTSDTARGSKEERRQAISRKDTIILLLGDNLGDMDKAFDKRGRSRLVQAGPMRAREADSLQALWGSRYIVFPNPVYGDWEQALYVNWQQQHPGIALSQPRKDSLRKLLLSGF